MSLKPFSEARFYLNADYVISKNDGDWHFIDVKQLLDCYGLPRNQVVNLAPNYSTTLIYLGPRYDGDYKEHLEARLTAAGYAPP